MPFDPQGFMAFRIAAMTFAATSLLSLWTVVRRLGGVRAARFALLLGATTPFLVHEIWFTWPKLFAASFVVLAVVALIDRRPLAAGLLGGIAYLTHPGALIFLPALFAIALWPLVGAHLRRPQIRPAALVVVGAVGASTAGAWSTARTTRRAASWTTSPRPAGASRRHCTTGSSRAWSRSATRSFHSPRT